MAVVNACTMASVHARTLAIVHVSCPTGLMFDGIESGGSKGRRPPKGRQPPNGVTLTKKCCCFRPSLLRRNLIIRFKNSSYDVLHNLLQPNFVINLPQTMF